MNRYSSSDPHTAAEETRAFKRLVDNLTKNTLWIYVLKLLKTRPYYGYELRKALEEHFSITTTRVTSYVILKKLEKEGLVTEAEYNEENMTGKPARIYYVITPFGEELFKLAAQLISGVYSHLFSKPLSVTEEF
ncbi:MAG: PadR family transcriptional regulator [Candidatus Hermodarchaeota archaeon]